MGAGRVCRTNHVHEQRDLARCIYDRVLEIRAQQDNQRSGKIASCASCSSRSASPANGLRLRFVARRVQLFLAGDGLSTLVEQPPHSEEALQNEEPQTILDGVVDIRLFGLDRRRTSYQNGLPLDPREGGPASSGKR
jgi:hypothetical protein